MGRKKYPILSASEELALATAWREHGDVEARNRLIEFFFPFAGKIAARYDGGGIPIGWQVERKPYHQKTAYVGRNDGGQPGNDIGQVAILGLIEAANRFDPALGYRFSTYARWWIRKCIQEHLAHLKKSGADVNGGRALGINAAVNDGEGNESEFASILIENPGGGIGGVFYNVRAAGYIPRPAEDILIRRHEEEIHEHALAVALAELDDRERRIFTARFIDDPKVILKFLAAEFSVSQKHISTIAEQAKDKVRASYERTVALFDEPAKIAA
jgi:RNA polymerase sigma-32 factor